MSNAEKVALGTTLAGVNQYKVFAAVMNNFGQAVKATEESLNSSGATARQNAIYMESLEAKITELKAEFEKLVLGDGGLQNFAKTIVDLGTKILKFANSDFGQLVIKVGLVIGAITLLYTGMLKLQGAFVSTSIVQYTSALVGLVAQYGLATTATTVLADAVEYLNLALMENPFVLVATAIVGTIVAINKYQEATLATRETTEELNDAITDLKNNITESESNIESITNKLDQLNKQKLNITDENQLNILNEEEASLERQLKIEQKKLEVTRQELELKAKATLQEKQSSDNLGDFATDKFSWTSYGADGKSTKSSISGGNVFSDFETEAQWLQDLKDYYLDLADSKREIEQANAEMSNSYAENKDKIEANNLALQQIEEQMGKVSQKGLEIAENINNATSALDENDESSKELIDTNNEAVDSFLNVIDANSELNESLNESAEVFDNLSEAQQEDLDELLEAHGELGEHLEEIAKKMAEEGVSAEEAAESLGYLKGEILTVADAQKELDSAMSNLTSMASNYDVLANAMNEYNNSGAMSLDTLSKLTALSSDWINLLEVENGVMSVSEQGLKALANSYIDDAEAKAYNKAMAELEAEAQKQSNAVHRDGQSAGNSSASGSNAAAKGATNAANAALKGAQAFSEFWKQATKGQYQGKVSTSTINSVGNALQTTLKTLESFRTSVNSNTTAAIKNTGATTSNTKATGGGSSAKKANTKATDANTKSTSSNTSAVDENTEALKRNVDALKAQKDALQKEIDDYEKVINYLNKKVDEEIKKLEKARDAEVDTIKAQIDYYEDLADKEDEELKNKIDNLEKAKDAEKDYWDNRINELKDANKALEDQLELEKLLQNLESAKKKKLKVYKEGQGFVYDSDTEAISKAQRELDEYYRKKALDDQIKGMEKQRDEALALYNKQINDLENYRNQQKLLYSGIVDDLKAQIDKIKANYEVQIKYFEDWKEKFAQQTSAYENEVLRQLTIQKTGIDTEAKNWTTRLSNLDNFVENYNAKLKELGDLETQLRNAEDAYNRAIQAAQSYTVPSLPDEPSGGGGYGGGGGSPTPTTPTVPTYNWYLVKKEAIYGTESAAKSAKAELTMHGKQADYYKYTKNGVTQYVVYLTANKTPYKGKTASEIQTLGKQKYGEGNYYYWQYATGVASVGSNQMALVGDDPRNRELVIGSKLNGTAMNLQKGSGVVNAESTKTLAGLMNCLGKFSSSNFGVGNGVLSSSTNNSNDMYIDKVVIEGSNITDIVSFKNSLMNLKSEATQRAYKRS